MWGYNGEYDECFNDGYSYGCQMGYNHNYGKCDTNDGYGMQYKYSYRYQEYGGSRSCQVEGGGYGGYDSYGYGGYDSYGYGYGYKAKAAQLKSRVDAGVSNVQYQSSYGTDQGSSMGGYAVAGMVAVAGYVAAKVYF